MSCVWGGGSVRGAPLSFLFFFTSSAKKARNRSFCSYRAASLACSFSACFLRKANLPKVSSLQLVFKVRQQKTLCIWQKRAKPPNTAEHQFLFSSTLCKLIRHPSSIALFLVVYKIYTSNFLCGRTIWTHTSTNTHFVLGYTSELFQLLRRYAMWY